MAFLRRLFGLVQVGNANNEKKLDSPDSTSSHGNERMGEREHRNDGDNDNRDPTVSMTTSSVASCEIETEKLPSKRIKDVVKSTLLPSSSKPKETKIVYEFQDPANINKTPDLDIYNEHFHFVVHQDLMVEKSCYVKTLLASGMQESQRMTSKGELRFYDSPPTGKALKLILDHLYGREVDIPSDECEQEDLMAAADFLEITLPTNLFTNIVTLENWSYYLSLSKVYNWDKLEDLINLVLAAHYRFLKDGAELSGLPQESISKIEKFTKRKEIEQFSRLALCMVLQHESNSDSTSGKILCCYDEKIRDWMFLDVFPPRCTEFSNSLHSSFKHNYVALKVGHYSRRHFEYDPYSYRAMQIVSCNPSENMRLVPESFMYNTFTGNWNVVSHMTPPGLSRADLLLAESEDVLYAVPPYLTKKKGLIVYMYQYNHTSPLHWQRHVVTPPHFQEDSTTADIQFLNACLHQGSVYALCSEEETDLDCQSLHIIKVTRHPHHLGDEAVFEVDSEYASLDTQVNGNYARILASEGTMLLVVTSSSRVLLTSPNTFVVFQLQENTTATFRQVAKVPTTRLGIKSLREFLQDCKMVLVDQCLYLLSPGTMDDIIFINIATKATGHISLPHFIFDPRKDIVALFPLGVPRELGICATMLKQKKIDIVRDDI